MLSVAVMEKVQCGDSQL